MTMNHLRLVGASDAIADGIGAVKPDPGSKFIYLLERGRRERQIDPFKCHFNILETLACAQRRMESPVTCQSGTRVPTITPQSEKRGNNARQ